jgi:hypothetical protein
MNLFKTAWDKIIAALNGMVTESDNKTHDILKHGAWVGILAVLAHDYYQLSHGVAVNVKDLAFSVSAILGACGAGCGLKSGTEHPNA